jgi:type IV pilus assembly protein PilN
MSSFNSEEEEIIQQLLLENALEVVGIDKTNGEFLYAFTPKIKEVMPDYKIDFLNPLTNISDLQNLKSRVDADKNSASRSVSIGLASRRLDIFGYFKFVTAVSNINLLPNRDDKIQEQKRKAVVSESAKKAGVVLGAVGCFVLVLSLLFGFVFSYADKVDLARNQYQQEEEKKNQLEAQYNNLQSFINQSFIDFKSSWST